MNKKNKNNAKIIGILFVINHISSIIGLILHNPILKVPNYFITTKENANQITLRLFVN